jgi:hypothetical protein
MNLSLLQRSCYPIPGRVGERKYKPTLTIYLTFYIIVDDKVADLYSKLEALSKNSGGSGGISEDDLKKLMKKKLKKYVKEKDFDKFVKHEEKEWGRFNKWEPVWIQMEKDIAELKS